MLIVHNPKKGAPIPKFNFEGIEIAGLQDPEVVLAVDGFGQFENRIAQFMKQNWGFLEIVTSIEAQKIMAISKAGEFKCEFCDFSTDVKKDIDTHLKAFHKDELVKESEPAIDPSIIPVVQGKKISGAGISDPDEAIATQGGSKVDRDGVSWYGPGAVEEPRSQSVIGPLGKKGHFGGSV